jgi:hypothetical protein
MGKTARHSEIGYRLGEAGKLGYLFSCPPGKWRIRVNVFMSEGNWIAAMIARLIILSIRIWLTSSVVDHFRFISKVE